MNTSDVVILLSAFIFLYGCIQWSKGSSLLRDDRILTLQTNAAGYRENAEEYKRQRDSIKKQLDQQVDRNSRVMKELEDAGRHLNSAIEKLGFMEEQKKSMHESIGNLSRMNEEKVIVLENQKARLSAQENTIARLQKKKKTS